VWAGALERENVGAETSLSADDRAWIAEYAEAVRGTFEGVFDASKPRFKDGRQLLHRFTVAIDDVLKNGRGRFRAVDEAHNELCTAAAILQNRKPTFSLVEYEPRLPACTKYIDFRACADDGATLYVDVKTIKPLPRERWEQYEKAQREGWFPDNVRLLFEKDWLGGELWHNAFAARSRMLEYALELEQKIADCELHGSRTFFVLLLCGEGFYWHESELEDFVAFYFTGTHRSDDPFARAETRFVAEKNIRLTMTISRFACMRRPQGDIQQRRLNWNVQPPRDPSFQ
jgi:hypothetical protein